MMCRTLLLAHKRMAQPLAWSGGSLCVAYARASMPRVPRGPRRPPCHAWHRLVRPNLAAPAVASLLAIISVLSVAAGAAGKAAGNSYYVRNAKPNVPVPDPAATSHCRRTWRIADNSQWETLLESEKSGFSSEFRDVDARRTYFQVFLSCHK